MSILNTLYSIDYNRKEMSKPMVEVSIALKCQQELGMDTEASWRTWYLSWVLQDVRIQKNSSNSEIAMGKPQRWQCKCHVWVSVEVGWTWTVRDCYSEPVKVCKQTLKYFLSKVKGNPHIPPGSFYLIPVTSALLTQCLCRPVPIVYKEPEVPRAYSCHETPVYTFCPVRDHPT